MSELQVPDFYEQESIESIDRTAARVHEPERASRPAPSAATMDYVFGAIRVALALLGRNVLLLLSGAGAFGLFAWAMQDPRPLAIVNASLFSALVFLPVLYANSKRGR